MTYTNFILDYLEKSKQTPSYRLGQHFINLFIEDESDPLIEGLWQADHVLAGIMIINIINTYQWDYDDMPLLDRGE